MSYVQYSRPKAPCGALNVRGMGQDSTTLPPLDVPTVSSNPFASLFASTDISTWGAGEYIAIGIAVIAGYTILRSIFSAGSAVKSTVRKRRRRAKKRKDLLDELGSI